MNLGHVLIKQSVNGPCISKFAATCMVIIPIQLSTIHPYLLALLVTYILPLLATTPATSLLVHTPQTSGANCYVHVSSSQDMT